MTDRHAQTRPIRVLFLCIGNSARSILVEALLRQRGGDRFEVRSAGTSPKGVNPLTLRVLREAGVDVTGLRSDSIDLYRHDPFDYVVTLCDEAREACPFLPGQHTLLHWGLPDPAAVEGDEEVRLDAFRSVFSELEHHLATFVAGALASAGLDSGRPSPSGVP